MVDNDNTPISMTSNARDTIFSRGREFHQQYEVLSEQGDNIEDRNGSKMLIGLNDQTVFTGDEIGFNETNRKFFSN